MFRSWDLGSIKGRAIERIVFQIVALVEGPSDPIRTISQRGDHLRTRV